MKDILTDPNPNWTPSTSVKRGPATPPGAVRTMTLRGPESILDRFVAYTNDTADSYWQALDQLLRNSGR